MPDRPRLTPAIADVRRAVRAALADAAAGWGPRPDPQSAESATSAGLRLFLEAQTRGTGALATATGSDPLPAIAAKPAGAAASGTPLVLVALSGGPDSLALAAAAAFEAPRAGVAAGAVIVDHGLQPGSSEAAARAAEQAERLGLAPVLVRRAEVGTEGGPEAAARDARYAALEAAATETGAVALLLGHTLDDQAETVLLGLARGSGAASLRGMAPRAGLWVRPLLGIPRSTTHAACDDAGLAPWTDPQNSDPAYARVRVRETVLPVLESELGPGVAAALARTAEQLREDSEALDAMAGESLEDLVELEEAGLSLSVAALAANPAALRQRMLRLAVEAEFHVALSRTHTLELARLVTDWHGQGPLELPGFRASRSGGRIHLVSTRAGELAGRRPPQEH